jgi:GNAT superfamily N-acetyltransferase
LGGSKRSQATDKKARRGHRTVVLPDFQGVGIGRHLVDYCASMWNGLGYRVFSGTGHPAEIRSRMRYGNWRCTRAPGMSSPGKKYHIDRTRVTSRLSASFEWKGEPMDALRAAKCLEARAT